MAVIVYVLTNPAMPDLVKIGFTSRKELSTRMEELHTTGVPLPFECAWALEVEDDQMGRDLERALHQSFTQLRVNPKREFFRLDTEDAVAVLKVFPGTDVTPQLQDKTGELDPVAREASERLKRQRRPNLNFEIMAVPVGATLIHRTTEEEAEIIGPKKVRFRDEEVSLSKATTMARGGGTWAPQPDWTYNGRRLSDIWQETMIDPDD